MNNIEKQYRRERNRILSRIRAYEKKGLFVNQAVPAIPKKITQASVNRLQKIDLRTIRQNTHLVSEDGERLGGYYRGVEILRYGTPISDYESEENQIFEALVVITNFRRNLALYDAELGVNLVESFLDSAIARAGEVAVAMMIIKADENGDVIDRSTIYNMERLRGVLGRMLSYLGDFPILQDELEETLDNHTWEELM